MSASEEAPETPISQLSLKRGSMLALCIVELANDVGINWMLDSS